MILEKTTPGGGILTGSCFTNRVGREGDITPWHKRRTPKGAKKDITAPSGVSDEVTRSSEPIPNLTDTPRLSIDDSTSNYISPFSPPMPGTSLATAYSNGFIQPDPDTSFLEEDFVFDPIWDVHQPSPWNESDAFSGAYWGFSTLGDSSFHCQLGSEPTSEGNHYSAPAFRDANMPAQTANNAGSEGIYSLGSPSRFDPQNIYPPNNAAPEDIYSLGYPSRFERQNIYAANSPAFAAPNQNIYIQPTTRAPPTGDDLWLDDF